MAAMKSPSQSVPAGRVEARTQPPTAAYHAVLRRLATTLPWADCPRSAATSTSTRMRTHHTLTKKSATNQPWVVAAPITQPSPITPCPPSAT